jgi:DHA3 family macrolide efflux protein-like MFS transporter
MIQCPTTRGFRVFGLVWFGQLVSLIGSGLTGFALSVWAYQAKDSATAYTLIVLATMGPNALLSLVAGPFVDRWDRRWVMILSDTGAGLCTLTVFLLLSSQQFALWPILLATAANSAFSAFQWPAYAASTALLVPKEHLGRANGLVQLAQGLSYLIPPALAGFLMSKIQVEGIILIDFATFAFAILTLLFIRIPKPATSKEETIKGSWWHEFIYGTTYLTKRPGLMGMLILFSMLNFLLGFILSLFGPMVLAFTDADTLGAMTTIGATGMLFGGGLMSIWGGPKRRIHGVLGGLMLAGLALSLGGLHPSTILITAAAFGFFACFAIVGASSDAIWQSKVAPDVQGRIFGTRSTIATLSMIPAYALAGPLADRVFEPLLVTGGPLVKSIGQIIGVGPGRGIGLIFIAAGILTTLTTLGAYLHPRIRLVEDELPDAAANQSINNSDKMVIQ